MSGPRLLLAVAFVVASAPVQAEISACEARALIERTTGASLEGADAFEFSKSPARIGFIVDEGPRTTYWVNRTSGAFEGFGVASLLNRLWEVEEPMEEAAALRTASDCAATYIPGVSLTWETLAAQHDRITFLGRGPMAGDPPRHGLTPECLVVVMRADGRVARYQQHVPALTDPVGPFASRQLAVEVAQGQGCYHPCYPRDAEPRLIGEPFLYQTSDDEVVWSVTVGIPQGRSERVEVFAVNARDGSASAVDSLERGTWAPELLPACVSGAMSDLWPASALTFAEAVDLARRACGGDVHDAAWVHRDPFGGGDRLAVHFRGVSRDGPCQIEVSASGETRVVVHLLDRDPGEGADRRALSREEAVAVTREAARRVFGTAAAGLGWSATSQGDDGSGLVRGKGRVAGRPRRGGASPCCSASFGLRSGKLMDLYLWSGPPDEPLTPRVTADEALALVRERIGEPRATPTRPPSLHPYSSALVWRMVMGGVGATVDAMDGSVTLNDPVAYSEDAKPETPESISVDAARSIAENAAGCRLNAAPPEMRRAPIPVMEPPWHLVVFTGAGGLRCAVDRLSTTVVALVRDEPPTAAARPIGREEAVAAVRAVAARSLPADAPDMTWYCVESKSGGFNVLGRPTPRGDPPIVGMRAECYGEVSPATGAVLVYCEELPPALPPAPPGVSAEVAEELARLCHGRWPGANMSGYCVPRHWTAPAAAPVLDGPYLRLHEFGRLVWRVTLGAYEGPEDPRRAGSAGARRGGLGGGLGGGQGLGFGGGLSGYTNETVPNGRGAATYEVDARTAYAKEIETESPGRDLPPNRFDDVEVRCLAARAVHAAADGPR